MRLFNVPRIFSNTRIEDEEVPLNDEDIELQHPADTHPTSTGSARSSLDEPRPRHAHRSTHRRQYHPLGGLIGGWHSVVGLPGMTDDDTHGDATPAIHHHLKRKLYLLLEEPSSSQAAFWVNIVVSFLIVFSAVTTTIETIPAFRSSESNQAWFHLESTMVALFTLEYLLRFFAHSDSFAMLRSFLLSPVAILDFISIIPFYIEVIAKRDTTYEFRFTILRLFRLLRLFKSYKYSNTIIMTIEVMVVALQRSGDALSALFFFLVTSVVLFSTLLYFAERGVWDETLKTFVASDGSPSQFDSIPAAFWFVLVTITTTGYGDMVPVTFIGKLVTFPAMMFGVLLIALPSIIVGRNFTLVWEVMRQRQMYGQLQPNGRRGTGTSYQSSPGDHELSPQGNENTSPDLVDTVPPIAGPPPPSAGNHGSSGGTMIQDTPFGLSTAGLPGFDFDHQSFARQLDALTMITHQNQEAIQRILQILEHQAELPSNVTRRRSSAVPVEN